MRMIVKTPSEAAYLEKRTRKMTISIRIICLPAAWPELSRRVADFQRTLRAEAPNRTEPKTYWKDARFFLFEQSFSADCKPEDVRKNCSLLFGGADRSVLAENENEIEIGAFAFIPEMLADSHRAFIYLYGRSA